MASRQKKGRKTSTTKPVFIRIAKPDDLKGTDLFKDVKDEIIKRIQPTSYVCRLEANQRLNTTRRGVNYLYIILKGYVAVWIPSCFDPEQQVFLAWRGPQQIIGELRERGAKPSKTAIETCDPCEFIEIRLDLFLRLAKKNCLLYRNVAHLLLKKMYNEGHRSEVVQMTNVVRQVAQTLAHLAKDRCEISQDQERVEIPGTLHHDQLAAYAGVSLRHVYRGLNALKKRQIISSNGLHITVLRWQDLLKVVQS